jgi:hypothetical protein
MKTIITKRIISFLAALVLTATFTSAQKKSIIGKFKISEVNGIVYLDWAIIAGSTCNGIQIYRSTDSISFTQIGSIPGICGSTTFSQPYDFTDENPVKNKVNYYRLSLGGSGLSEILSVEIINLDYGNYQVRPNPVNNQAKVYFDNEKKELHHLSLFNQTGTQLLSTSTKQNYFDLEAASFSSGVYLFTITDLQNTVKAKGKLVLQH